MPGGAPCPAGARRDAKNGKRSSKPRGKRSSKPRGKRSSKPRGKRSSKPRGKRSGKRSGKPRGKRSGKPRGKPSGKPGRYPRGCLEDFFAHFEAVCRGDAQLGTATERAATGRQNGFTGQTKAFQRGGVWAAHRHGETMEKEARRKKHQQI